jgi:hypothetical protein
MVDEFMLTVSNCTFYNGPLRTGRLTFVQFDMLMVALSSWGSEAFCASPMNGPESDPSQKMSIYSCWQRAHWRLLGTIAKHLNTMVPRLLWPL